MCVLLKKLAAEANNCADKIGGLVAKFWVAKAEDVESIPAPAPANQKVITDDIVMKAGKTFTEWNFQKDTGKVYSSSVGAEGSLSFEDMIDFIFPTATKDALEQTFFNANTELIAIVKKRNGQTVIVGSLDLPAYFSEIKADGGLKGADPDNIACKLKALSGKGYKIYEGVIPLAA
ncbi:hypothetical protein AD998_07540 [bacterium 336/3]|nr:hypothetical protein AD998_07540 [bacterium 336/3]